MHPQLTSVARRFGRDEGGNIKDKSIEDVLVFSIAFGNPPSKAKQTLSECASASAYYAEAGTGKELEAAFSKFAGILNKLRLTQ